MFKQIASQHSRRLVKVAETRHFSISHVRQKTITEKVGEMAQNVSETNLSVFYLFFYLFF